MVQQGPLPHYATHAREYFRQAAIEQLGRACSERRVHAGGYQAARLA